MESNNSSEFDNVYVSLNILPTEDLIQVQKSIGSLQHLILRPEFHITFAFFGKLSYEQIQTLGDLLSSLVTKEFKLVEITGIGGAYKNESNKSEYTKSLVSSYIAYPRVFWLSVHCESQMIEFRNSLISTAIGLGLPSEYLRPTFTPHITLGSAGPDTPNSDWSLWDVHDIAKIPIDTHIKFPKSLTVESLHITCTAINPKSLYTIR